MTNNYKPLGTPSLVPYFTVVNAERSIKFYQDAFGFTLRSSSPNDEGKIEHAEMEKGEALIMFCSEGAFETTNKAPVNLGIVMPLSLYVYCPNVDELYAQAIKNGAISKIAPNDSFWGDRFCAFVDPDGYEWSFASLIKAE